MLRRLSSEYGMLAVLAALCLYYSAATWREQWPEGAEAARQVSEAVERSVSADRDVLIVARDTEEARAFAGAVEEDLREGWRGGIETLYGEPPDLRARLEQLIAEGRPPAAIAVSREVSEWRLLARPGERFPELAEAPVISPHSYRGSDFLKGSNLQAIVDRIVVIAIIAIGMTMVIITGGIDLSVGSIIALAAVGWTLLIRELAGAKEATPAGTTLCAFAALAGCGLLGWLTGLAVTRLSAPPFIVTLAVMLAASGLAFTLASGQSVYEVPQAIARLGRGEVLGGLPVTVLLMAGLYAVAHLLMTRTPLGRSIYAVGGNPEAARLSGIPVRRVTVFVYAVCGALAGLGGIVQASQLASGAPTYGQTYELYVIAAVVVGGTSLSGGEGSIFGTLVGALIIAVIQNGMNLTGVESYTQKIVLGLVILGAVVLDRVKRGELGFRWGRRERAP